MSRDLNTANESCESLDRTVEQEKMNKAVEMKRYLETNPELV